MKTKKSIWILCWVMFIIPVLPLLGQEIPVTTNSKEAKKFFIQGRDKLENSQSISAAELFDKAIALDDNFALAHLYRTQSGGTSDQVRKHRDKALSLIDRVSAGEKHLIQYVLASEDGDQVEREANIYKLLTQFPKDKRVHLMHGQYLSSLEKPMEAADAYYEAIQIDKKYAPAYNLLGYANMDLKNWPESEKAFKKYIELQPDNPNPYDSYADMLLKSGKFDEALENFKKAYSLDETFISSLSRIGLVYVHKGEFEKARESYRELFDKAPSYNWKMSALANDAQSYLHEGKFDEAVSKYEAVAALATSEKQDNGVIHTLSNIGWIQLENGDVASAATTLKEARQLNETADISDADREVNRLFGKIERVQLLMAVNELETAESVLSECKTMIDERKNPVETGIYHTLVGMLERSKGNYDKSLEAFTQSNFDDPYALYQKALTQESMGDLDAAMTTYKEVINWNFGGLPYAMVRYRAKQKVEVGLVAK